MLEASEEYDVILFTMINIAQERLGFVGAPTEKAWPDYQKYIGSYRLRTFLEQFGYKVKVIDYSSMMTFQQVDKMLEKLITSRTKIIGANSNFGQYSKGLRSVDSWIKKLKVTYPHIKFVLGGQSAVVTRNRGIVSADLYVDGYGENALLAILEDKVPEGEIDLDGTFGYGFPNEYITQWKDEDCIKKYDVLPLETARGCIFKCKFCSFPLVGKKKNDYLGNFDDIGEQLRINYDRWGVTRYSITEETFNDNVFKLEEFLKVVEKLPFKFGFSAYIKPELLVAKPEQIDLLVALGLENTNIGIESLYAPTRKAIAKGYDYEPIGEALATLKKKALANGNWAFGNALNVICGLPYETPEKFIEGMKRLNDSYECDRINVHQFQLRRNDGMWLYTSPIEQEPEKYGYTSREQYEYNEVMPNLWWDNNYGINFDNSIDLVVECGKFHKASNMRSGLGSKTAWFPDTLTGTDLGPGFNLYEFYINRNADLNKITPMELQYINASMKQRVSQFIEYQIKDR